MLLSSVHKAGFKAYSYETAQLYPYLQSVSSRLTLTVWLYKCAMQVELRLRAFSIYLKNIASLILHSEKNLILLSTAF